ncbi:MAG: hypothetical protein AB7E47_06710 [Desulfovibrionaceae bacterium]
MLQRKACPLAPLDCVNDMVSFRLMEEKQDAAQKKGAAQIQGNKHKGGLLQDGAPRLAVFQVSRLIHGESPFAYARAHHATPHCMA